MAANLNRTPTHTEVEETAQRIVDAFARTDTTEYFSGFAPECSFIFHPESERLNSRAAYEELWAGWLADGWRVLSCISANHGVTAFPGGAVFTHDIETSVFTGGSEESYRERETIVFRTTESGSLLAIHEHLSPAPAI